MAETVIFPLSEETGQQLLGTEQQILAALRRIATALEDDSTPPVVASMSGTDLALDGTGVSVNGTDLRIDSTAVTVNGTDLSIG